MNIGVHLSLSILVFSVCMPSSGIAGSYGKDGNDNPVCETAKETQKYRTVFWTLWEREMGMIWENGIKTCIISYKK